MNKEQEKLIDNLIRDITVGFISEVEARRRIEEIRQQDRDKYIRELESLEIEKKISFWNKERFKCFRQATKYGEEGNEIDSKISDQVGHQAYGFMSAYDEIHQRISKLIKALKDEI